MTTRETAKPWLVFMLVVLVSAFVPQLGECFFFVSAFRLNDDATSNGFFIACFAKVSPGYFSVH